ncbi:MAG TPA: polyprenyl synthetase family protein [Deltaproteobacteria bacterium]|nr:polyprenyl synthetase family protein [Deltaproteobacteria bacterium]
MTGLKSDRALKDLFLNYILLRGIASHRRTGLEITAIIAEKKRLFEDYLQEHLAGINATSGIFDAFSYSLSAGGKRIRPILTMLASETLGCNSTKALPAGLAIEMIHTFSLIHDDLPALDNDTLRRGMPTCHNSFGEATAILAGDALIFQALSVISSSDYTAEVEIDILRMIADVCGIDGLVQGEYMDVMAEGKDLAMEEIADIYLKKTSRLFELCMYCGARIATDDRQKIQSLVRYGTYLGLAFQAVDDILDITSTDGVLGKTSGKDLIQGKATLVKALGVEKAGLWAVQMTNEAIRSIARISDIQSTVLEELARWMLQRVM